ncbi:MAG: TetR/AcrR family transcriptional regulator [Clostridia bacterium]|nr:TetR/AcrR family transcriptional regulator [Clostridia bacterium]
MNKKEQILEAALKLFNTYGFDKTPTSQIAKEAGVATGTLFHYFSTKEELINHLYLRCKDSMLKRVLDGVENEKAYRGKIRRAYGNLLKWGLECAQEFLFFQQFSNSASILESTRQEGRERFQVIYDLIEMGVRDEILKDIDPELLLNCIIGLVISNILFLMGSDQQDNAPELTETTFTLLWDAIKR